MTAIAKLADEPQSGTEISRAQDFMPVFQIEQAVQRQKAMTEFIGKILKKGVDFGSIPGARQDKKELLKPGAEKLCTFFGLAPRFECESLIEDWVGTPEHGGEPLFYYRYRCALYRGERFVGEGIGSANSWEKKHRYRNADRVCPACGQPAIITGKAEYGGGFICFKKKGGCGSKFAEDAEAIVSQKTGQVRNPDFADLPNTLQKMSMKRALVAAVLLATNASDCFTQDAGAEEAVEHPDPFDDNQPPEPTITEQQQAEMLELVEATTQVKWWLEKNGVATLDLFPVRLYEGGMKWLRERWQKQNPGKTLDPKPADAPKPAQPPKPDEPPKPDARISPEQDRELSALIREKGADVGKLLHPYAIRALQQLPAKAFAEVRDALLKLPWPRQPGDEPEGT